MLQSKTRQMGLALREVTRDNTFMAISRPQLNPSASRLKSLACRRAGLSLLEIVLALGIFLGTFAVISQIINTGARAAMQAQAENEATLRAERILNEVLAGALPFTAAGPVPFEDDARWSWSVDITDGPHPDLRQIQTTASRQRKDGVVDMTISLSRYARDPQLYLDAAATASTTLE